MRNKRKQIKAAGEVQVLRPLQVSERELRRVTAAKFKQFTFSTAALIISSFSVLANTVSVIEDNIRVK